MEYNCLACTKSCTPATSLTDPAAADVGAALVADVKSTINFSGTDA